MLIQHPPYSNCNTEEVTEIPLSFSISIQSDTACFAVAFPLTEPAWLIAPPYKRNFSVNVVLPASGCEIIAAGLLGSFLFSHYYDKNKYLFVKLVMISVAAALLLLYPISKAHMAVVLLCAFWGMAVMAFNVTFQSEIITYAPAAASSVAMAIYSGIYNLGIGSGTWIGGSICTICPFPISELLVA